MPRPPLVLGTWGRISRARLSAGLWEASARYRDHDGVTRKVKRTGGTGAAAERALVEAMSSRARLPEEDLTPETRLRDAAASWWIEWTGEPRPANTVDAYRRSLHRLVLPALGGRMLREMTVPAIDRFLDATVAKNGQANAKTSRAVLGHVMKHAVRKGAIPANPMRDASTVRIAAAPVQAFDSVADILELRRCLLEWDGAVDYRGARRSSDLAGPVDFLIGTGVRTGELLALRWSDIDLEGATAEITGTLVTTKAGESAPGLSRQGTTKTKTSRRTLLLPPFVIAMLAQRWDASVGIDIVFPSSTGTWRSPHNFRRQWRDFRTACGYETWVTPRTFRKTVATLVARRVDLTAAADQLGHAGTNVTALHYAKRPDTAPDLRALLEEFGAVSAP